MRILDTDNDKALKNVNIYLTEVELRELLGDLKGALDNKGKSFHSHLNDLMYEHEITIALYDENDIGMFDERSKKIIESDE